jgi:hypothetical protein
MGYVVIIAIGEIESKMIPGKLKSTKGVSEVFRKNKKGGCYHPR